MRRFPMEKPVNRIVERNRSAINQTQNGERGRKFGDRGNRKEIVGGKRASVGVRTDCTDIRLPVADCQSDHYTRNAPGRNQRSGGGVRRSKTRDAVHNVMRSSDGTLNNLRFTT
jgi:hypothetical protein